MQLCCRQHVPPNGVHQWTQQCAGSADPTGQQRAIKVNAFASVDDGLAVQWQMIGEIRHQDMREQTEAGDAALNRAAFGGSSYSHEPAM